MAIAYDSYTMTNITTITGFFTQFKAALNDHFHDDQVNISNVKTRTSNRWSDTSSSTSYTETYIDIRIKNPFIGATGSDSNVGISLFQSSQYSYNIVVCPCYYKGDSTTALPCTWNESDNRSYAAKQSTGSSSSTPFFSGNAATVYTITRYCLDEYSTQYEIVSSSAPSAIINFGFLIVKDMVGQSHVFVCGHNSWLNNISLTAIPTTGTDSSSGYAIFAYHDTNQTAQRVTLQTVNPSLFPTSADLVKFVFVPFGFSAKTSTRHFYNLRFDNNKRLYVLCDSGGPRAFTPGIAVSIDGTTYTSLKRIFKLVTDDSYEPDDGLLAAESSVF